METLNLSKILDTVKKAGFEKSFINTFVSPKKIIIRKHINVLRPICTMNNETGQTLFEKRLYLTDEHEARVRREVIKSKASGTIVSDYPYSELTDEGILVKDAFPFEINIAQIYRTGDVLNIEYNPEFFSALGKFNEDISKEVKSNLKKMSQEIKKRFIKNMLRNRPLSKIIIESEC